MPLRLLTALVLLTALAVAAGCRGPANTSAAQPPGAATTAAQPTARTAAATPALREVTDMAGRTVKIPATIRKIYTAQPYTTVLLYVVAPDLMVGMQPGCLPLREEDKRFLCKEVANLPMVSTQAPGGEKAQVNMEAILALKPDLALAMGGGTGGPMGGAKGKASPTTGEPKGPPMGQGKAKGKGGPPRMVDQFAKIGLPVVMVDIDSISDYPAGIEFLGKLLGREERAQRLSAYAVQVFADVGKMVAAIPPEKRVRVYYAESADGLATESDRSLHADAIRMAGGNIVHKGELKTHQGMEKVSLEQVLLYNPEVIISQEKAFADFAYHDPRWQKVKAVTNHRIYTVPRTPYNWIDRPPGIMRIIGVQWLANRFYPDRCYKTDIGERIREFHRLFMGVEVTDKDLDEWLS